ncbi:alpha/beta fold hydrolase [Corynebacterium sp.]|uniref:alpha/beta fold hydrolase n=1 Tax=Corynebacterium sp. TaxID=1720 RepID=UPI003B3A5059
MNTPVPRSAAAGTSPDLRTTSTRRHGHTVREHVLTAPLVHRRAASGDATDPRTIEVYAREYVPDGGEDRPVLLFLQGGPGHGAPRPAADGDGGSLSGWLGEALNHYRVILFDQRGTGRSTPVDVAAPEALGPTPQDQADYLTHLRADSIVADAELLRQVLGEDPWTLLGQSFGGFCITTYLSLRPEGVKEAFFTGGLPGHVSDPHTRVDDVYRATFAKTAVRNDRFYARFPWAGQRVAEICRHLDDTEETLPTGERLTSRRFRTVGMNLGRTGGFDTLAYLLEDPFRAVPGSPGAAGRRRLRTPFLTELAGHVTYADAPLYAVVHESIYGIDTATNWAAHRLREEVAGFAERTGDHTTYLTAEHFFPWQFEEDPTLRPWKEVADLLAAKDDWTPLYDADQLRQTSVPTAAAVYLDDIFVPFELSMETAATIRGLRPHVTNRWEHNGISQDGAAILRHLRALVKDH